MYGLKYRWQEIRKKEVKVQGNLILCGGGFHSPSHPSGISPQHSAFMLKGLQYKIDRTGTLKTHF